jgi:hypothetical protein
MNSYSSDIRPIVLKFTDHTSISLYISLFLKLTVHSTYAEKLQINEQIKLYTIYTNTVNLTNFDIKNRNQNKICRFPQHVLITSFHTLK